MHLLSRQIIIALTVVLSFATSITFGQESFLTPSPGYQSTEYLADRDFDAFGMVDADTVLLYNGVREDPGIEIVDLYSGETLLLPQETEICGGATRADNNLTASFIKPDPVTPNTYWVGFVANDGVDGWIYQVTATESAGDWTATWSQVALLAGNYGLEFSGSSLPLVSANTGAGNQILALDTSGANQHTVVADVGGYSAELGVNTAGDVYYASYVGWGMAGQLLRCSSSAVADALATGGSPCQPKVLCEISIDGDDFGGNGMAVDEAGHVLFTGYGSTGHLALWDETTGTLSEIATTSSYLGIMEAVGDLNDGGAVYVTAWGRGIEKLVKSIPGDANDDGKVDGSDVTILADNWQAGTPGGNPLVTWEMGDFNGDHMVDGSDVTILADNWQYGVAAVAVAVPEPSMVALLAALGLIAGIAWRRR